MYKMQVLGRSTAADDAAGQHQVCVQGFMDAAVQETD